MTAPLSIRLAATTCLAAFVAGATSFASPAQAGDDCGRSYKIKVGDSLESIAANCGTTVGDIMRLNRRIEDPVILPVGYELKISRRDDVNPVYWNPDRRDDGWRDARTRDRDYLRRVNLRDGTYIVRRGDTLGDIADGLNVSVRSLVAANPQLRHPDELYAGEVIRLPGGARDGYPASRDRDGGSGFQNIGYVQTIDYPGYDDGVDTNGSYMRVGEQISFEGVVTPEGNKCSAVRNAGGRLFTLVSSDRRIDPGDKVRVSGRVAPGDWCAQGISVAVTSVEFDNNGDGRYRSASSRDDRGPGDRRRDDDDAGAAAKATVILRDERNDDKDGYRRTDFKPDLPPVGRVDGRGTVAALVDKPRETVRGVVTKEGRDCTTVRAFDGTIYGIPARLTSVGFGEGIEITGARGPSQCRDGITFLVDRARKL